MTKLTHSCNCKITAERFDWMRRFGGWAWPIRKWAGQGRGGSKGLFLTKCLSSFNNSRWLQKIWLNLSRFWTKYDTNIPGGGKTEREKGKYFFFFKLRFLKDWSKEKQQKILFFLYHSIFFFRFFECLVFFFSSCGGAD